MRFPVGISSSGSSGGWSSGRGSGQRLLPLPAFWGQNGGVTREPEQQPPSYLRPANLLLVFAGGSLGVLARELLMLAVPDVSGLPMAVLIANLVGALLLGLLLEALAARGSETDGRQRLRLLIGTGALGGFTTYSALAQAVALLWGGGSVGLALGYGLATLLFGALATWLGIALGARLGKGGRGSSSSPEAGGADD